MTIVANLTSDPVQAVSLLLPDGSKAIWTLTYRPQQKGWSWDLTWSNPNNPTSPFNLLGQRLTTHPNILRQFKNQIGFGIMVAAVGNAEPLLQTSFVDGSTTVYLLAAADVAQVESTIFPGF